MRGKYFFARRGQSVGLATLILMFVVKAWVCPTALADDAHELKQFECHNSLSIQKRCKETTGLFAIYEEAYAASPDASMDYFVADPDIPVSWTHKTLKSNRGDDVWVRPEIYLWPAESDICLSIESKLADFLDPNILAKLQTNTGLSISTQNSCSDMSGGKIIIDQDRLSDGNVIRETYLRSIGDEGYFQYNESSTQLNDEWLRLKASFPTLDWATSFMWHIVSLEQDGGLKSIGRRLDRPQGHVWVTADGVIRGARCTVAHWLSADAKKASLSLCLFRAVGAVGSPSNFANRPSILNPAWSPSEELRRGNTQLRDLTSPSELDWQALQVMYSKCWQVGGNDD